MDLLESQITSSGPITILGDLNIKVNDKNDSDTINFLDFIDASGLAIQNTEPTHRLGNTLDLIITEETSNHISSVKTDLFSDHNLVLFNVNSTSITATKRILSFCKIKNINIEKFETDIKQKIGNYQKLDDNTLDQNLDLFRKALTTTLDDHAPEQTKVVSNWQKIPWFNDSISDSIQLWCKLEHKWKPNKTSESYLDLQNRDE